MSHEPGEKRLRAMRFCFLYKNDELLIPGSDSRRAPSGFRLPAPGSCS
jgi:hypothetical protein